MWEVLPVGQLETSFFGGLEYTLRSMVTSYADASNVDLVVPFSDHKGLGELTTDTANLPLKGYIHYYGKKLGK